MRDNTTPVTFELPDGDTVQLITWEFVLKKLEEVLNPTIDHLSVINTQLEKIDQKLESWIKDNEDF